MVPVRGSSLRFSSNKGEGVDFVLTQIESLCSTHPANLLVEIAQKCFGKNSSEDSSRGLRHPALLTQSAFRSCTASDRIDEDELLGETGLLILDEVQGFSRSLASALNGVFDWEEYWRHSVAAGCTAFYLTTEAGCPGLKWQAFLAGLLHDIGKIGLAACFPKAYERVVHSTEAKRQCISDAEQELFGVDHALAGKRILAFYGMPARLQECVWLHHHPPATLSATLRDPCLAFALNLADNFVRRDGIGYSGYQHVEFTCADSDLLGVTDEGLERVNRRMKQATERLESLWQQRQTGEKYLEDIQLSGNTEPDYPAIKELCCDIISEIANELTGTEDPKTVCARICRASEKHLKLSQVGCFSVSGDSLASLTVYRDTGSDTYNTESFAIQDMHSGKLLNLVNRVNHISSNPGLLSPLEERFEKQSGIKPDYVILLSRDNRIAGGIVFSIQSGVNHLLLNASSEELKPLTSFFALILNNALRCKEYDRLADSLASSNRRLHAGQNARVQQLSLEMISQMAAGAAHELNNPLAVIAGRAQMLKRDLLDPELSRQVGLIDEHARQASQIVNELVQFAKPAPPRPKKVNLHAWAHRLAQYWQRKSSLKPDQISVRISDVHLEVYVDEEQISEAGGAILANAIEATKPENAFLIINSTSNASDDTVVVSFGDNGCGMSAEVMKHACDPFFSHRSAGRGRGLGLSRAARLVEVNGGRLWLESTQGSGSTIYLSLPARAK